METNPQKYSANDALQTRRLLNHITKDLSFLVGCSSSEPYPANGESDYEARETCLRIC